MPDRSFPISDVPKVRHVMSLKLNDEFLMHGVVLQNRVFRTRRAMLVIVLALLSMFHVKPFSPAPRTHPATPRCFTWNIFA
jgi:hypothetical protein